MASTNAVGIPAEDLASFHEHLKDSKRIMALCGAGLSAASGLPTFRGAGGLWRTHDAISLATPQAFKEDPGLVWQFYSYRRHMALNAKPNRAHLALAELARRQPDFITLTQNVDGLSPRAKHPPENLHLLHGSLFDVKCFNKKCNYVVEDYTDPIVPALAIPTDQSDPTSNEARKAVSDALNQKMGAPKELDISDAKVNLPALTKEDLPKCPKCGDVLRPGVVWFGESLPQDTIDTIENWIIDSKKIDLILVIGTSSKVYPAAAYTDRARNKGARVAVINMDRTDMPGRGLKPRDWFFQGDAGQILPELLKPVIGEIGDFSEGT